MEPRNSLTAEALAVGSGLVLVEFLSDSRLLGFLPIVRSCTIELLAEIPIAASLRGIRPIPARFPRQGLQRLMNFGAPSPGFGTCCLLFKTGTAATPARLPSAILA